MKSTLALLPLSLLTLIPAVAHADFSDRSKGIVWNVEHFIYMDKCRFDKPMPASPDSYYVADCERSYEQQEKNLAVLSDAEKKEPRAVAVFEMHKKAAAHIAKAKAAYEAATTAAITASLSCALVCSRRSSSSMEGGKMNTRTTSGPAS